MKKPKIHTGTYMQEITTTNEAPDIMKQGK
jgi:hypothetical protein